MGEGWIRGLLLAAMLFAPPVLAQDTLSLAAPWEISATDPSKGGFVFTRLEIAETLVDFDATGRPVPGLARDWSLSDDRLTWRFRLRPAVTFHDGTGLTPENAVAALRRAWAKPGLMRRAPIAAIAAEGADTVLVRLSAPFAPLPALLGHYSAQILAPASYDDSGAVGRVIGTGPYRIERLEPPQRLTAMRHETYWGAKPAIEKLAYLAVSRGETRALMAESGDAQILFNIDPFSRARLARNRKIAIHAMALPRSLSIKINAGHPILRDARARQALSLMLDRAGIARALMRDPAAEANQLFPPSLGDWHLPDASRLPMDRDKARALLGELGWMPRRDGMLERDGTPLRLSLRTFSDRPELPLIATAIQDQARAVGIAMDVLIGNSSDIPARHRDNTLELALIARNYGLLADPLGALLQDFSATGGDWGAMNWHDDTMLGDIDALLLDDDPARRRRIAQILQRDLPLIPIAWYQQIVSVSRSVGDFSIDPFERSYRISRMRWNP